MIKKWVRMAFASVFAVTLALSMSGCGASDTSAPADTGLIEVDSSIFSSVGYHADAQQLTVVFRDSGDIYVYQDVPQETFDALMAADSLGAYFHANIREAFEYERD